MSDTLNPLFAERFRLQGIRNECAVRVPTRQSKNPVLSGGSVGDLLRATSGDWATAPKQTGEGTPDRTGSQGPRGA